MAASASAQLVIDRAMAAGFALAGVCQATPTSYEQELLNWLAAGKHGEMDYLRRNVNLRIDPREMVPGAKSIIVVADRYAAANEQREAASGVAFGRIARYARGDDYHKVMRKRLVKLCDDLKQQHPNETFRACVDTAPVLEREHAQRAGLGAVGKNTLLINCGGGSYMLLGEIITTLEMEPSTPAAPDPCGTCTRCIDACPTQAITPWSVDATRCISYLTIEHRSTIDPQFHAAMGDWIFGCDVCQDVCPHNQPTQRRTPRMLDILPAYTPRHSQINLLDILNWDEAARQHAFAGSAMKRAKLNMMKRNALIAAGNSSELQACAPLLERVQQIAQDADEDAIVRTTASQVLERIVAAKSDRQR